MTDQYNRFRGYCLAGLLLASVLGHGIFATPLMADAPIVTTIETENHQQAIEAWRASRDERLKQPDGWLTLIALEWLKDGETRIGSAADNDIQLGDGPAYWGSVVLQDKQLYFKSLDPEQVKINGESLPHAELIADTEGEPTVITSGTLSINVIFRESYALRIKDSQARALQNFKGVDNYPIDESWRIDGKFIQAPEGTVIEIINVLGQVSEPSVFGTFEFEMDGRTHSLLGLGDADAESLWFIFADRTTGHGTYGAGRYLYSDGMPENGRLTVDFNKAYNPPCAFNPYSTCPIPPQRNRLDLMVLAGEKDFHPDSD
jgi:uncharacterized protein (DUF1684 family)